jgi:hypothetical protein
MFCKKLFVLMILVLLAAQLIGCGGAGGSASSAPAATSTGGPGSSGGSSGGSGGSGGGSGGGNGGGNGGGTAAGFSNASLKGTYVFRAVASDNSSFTFAAGVFTADGNGNLTNGTEDLNDSAAGPHTNLTFSGTYSVGADGRGLAITVSAFRTSTFKFVLASSTNGQVIEFDSSSVARGFILAQDQSAIANIAGTFVFNFVGEDFVFAPRLATQNLPLSSVGQVVLNGAGGVSGVEDINENGVFSPNVPFSGTYAVGSHGRGTATITSGLGTSNYVFYVVNAKQIEFVNVDPTPGIVESGEAVAQQGGAFGNSSLASIVFIATGEGTSTGAQAVAVGRFDTNGAGTILNGVLDENDSGTFFDGLPFVGAYSVDANGRGIVSATTSRGTSNYIVWLAAPGYGWFMESDTAAVASGTLFSQQSGPFNNSSFQGNYAFALAGASAGLLFASVGEVASDGSGGFTGTEDFNQGGATNSNVSLTGAYSIAPNGRGTAVVTGTGIVTTPIRIHLITSTAAVFISADPTQPLIGLVEKQ